MSSEFIYCTECGARLPAEARFCNVCGTRVLRAETVEGATSVPATPAWGEPSATAPAPGEAPLDMTVGDEDEGPPSSSTQPAATWGSEATATGSPAPHTAPPETPGPAQRSWDPPTQSPSLETTQTTQYPPRRDVRREDLDRPLDQTDATRDVAPAYYEEAEPGGFALRPGLLMAAIGFAIALVGVFLPWVSVMDRGDADAFTDNATFQIADVLDNSDPIDGFVVIGLAAVGLLFLVVEYVALRRVPIGRVFAALGGLALGALGVIELLYIRDAAQDVTYDYGAGLFMVIVGGATAIVGSLIPIGYDEG